MVKKLVAGILILVFTTGALAQTSADDKLTARMHSRVEKLFESGVRAKVELKDGRKFQGHIAELAADNFVLADGATSNTFRFSDIKKVGGFGPSPSTRHWVGLAVLGGLLGLTFGLAATQMR